MSFKPYTEKIKEEKNWNLFDFRTDPDPDPEPDPDPSSRKRIRGSGSGSASKWYGSETLFKGQLNKIISFFYAILKNGNLYPPFLKIGRTTTKKYKTFFSLGYYVFFLQVCILKIKNAFLVVSLSSSVSTRTIWISPRESKRKCRCSLPRAISKPVFPLAPLSRSVTVMAATREPGLAFSSTVANLAVWSGK